MKAAFVGFGELGHQLLALANTLYDFSTVVAFDDISPTTDPDITRYAFNDFTKAEFNDYSFFIGLGYNQMSAHHELVRRLLELNRDLPSLRHHTSFIDPTAAIGHAVYIYPMCTIDKGVRIENGCLLNNAVTVSHDSVVGECSYLSPSVTLSGKVHIGKRSFLGAGVVVANGVSIGDDARIGIGSVVSADVAAGASAIGNPLRLLETPLNL